MLQGLDGHAAADPPQGHGCRGRHVGIGILQPGDESVHRLGIADQDAAGLAFYAGWTRFGPAAERPSQLDIWNDEPRPGQAFLTFGIIPQEKRLFVAEDRARPPGPRCA